MDVPDFSQFSHDSIAKLPASLRRKVEAALLDPQLTYEDVRRRFFLDEESGEHFIAKSTFETNGKLRRDAYEALREKVALEHLRVRIDLAKELEKQYGSLGDAALQMAWRQVLAGLAAGDCGLDEMGPQAKTISNLARAAASHETAKAQETKRSEMEAAILVAERVAEKNPAEAFKRLRESAERLYGVKITS